MVLSNQTHGTMPLWYYRKILYNYEVINIVTSSVKDHDLSIHKVNMMTFLSFRECFYSCSQINKCVGSVKWSWDHDSPQFKSYILLTHPSQPPSYMHSVTLQCRLASFFVVIYKPSRGQLVEQDVSRSPPLSERILRCNSLSKFQ